MFFVLGHFWLWIFGALLCGLGAGYLTRDEEPNGALSPWLTSFFGAFLVAFLAVLLQALPDEAGLWLETVVWTGVAFLAGAALGTRLRGGSLREHRGWALGLIPALLLWMIANFVAGPSIQTGLSAAVGETLKNAGAAAPFSVFGRDVALAESLPNREALVAAINKIDGVRLVRAGGPIVDPIVGSPSGEPATPAEATKEPAKEPVNAAADPGQTTVVDNAKEAAEAKTVPAPPPPADKAEEAKAKLAALPATGALDAASCQTALNATVTVEKIQFKSGSATIQSESIGVLDRLAGLLKRCVKAKAEIGGHTDNSGPFGVNQALSERRASAVAQYLRKNGVAPNRLSAVGYGPTKPVASNDTEDGRAENRRIEFTLK